jgi:hypothetical protein
MILSGDCGSRKSQELRGTATRGTTTPRSWDLLFSISCHDHSGCSTCGQRCQGIYGSVPPIKESRSSSFSKLRPVNGIHQCVGSFDMDTPSTRLITSGMDFALAESSDCCKESIATLHIRLLEPLSKMLDTPRLETNNKPNWIRSPIDLPSECYTVHCSPGQSCVHQSRKFDGHWKNQLAKLLLNMGTTTSNP